MTDRRESVTRRIDVLTERIASLEVQMERLESHSALLQNDVRLALEKLTRLRLYLENKLG
jgi:hypothetical protein